MSARARIPLVLGVAALLGAAVPAQSDFVGDTITIVTTGTSAPAITITPDGTLHVGVSSSDAQRHFWREGSTWQSEIIATTSGGGSSAWVDFQNGPDGHLALLRRGAGGHLILHRRGASTWDADTIPAPILPPPGPSYSIGVDPVTDDPVVSWITSSGALHRLWIARRNAGVWTIVQLDSSSAMGPPSVALSSTGQIRLAVIRDGAGLLYAEAESETGPFTWTVADSTASYYNALSGTSLALDPASGEPRIAYQSYLHKYASRSGGLWTSQEIPGWATATPPCLDLDALGRPWIALMEIQPVLSGSFRSQQECGGVSSKHPFVFHREDATGTESFAQMLSVRGRETHGHALATHGVQPHLVWRDSDGAGCLPAAIVQLEPLAPAAVVPGSLAAPALRLGPNPLRPGDALQIRLRADQDGPVALQLTDVAGRRVAHMEHDSAPGDRAINWSIPALPAGWYRVHARQNGAVIGSAPLLVVN
jgi:hypothetical protein